MNDSKRRAIAHFWKTVESQRKKLAAIESADDPAYDACLEALHAVHEDLYLAISVDGDPRELVVTAEGERTLFDLAEQVVASAPVLAGWTVLALKPKVGFPETASWDDFEVEVASVSFEPLLAHEDDDELGIRFYVPGLAESELDDAHNALLGACDHGLGEKDFAESIEFTEIAALPEGKRASDFMPLTELDAFVAQRRARRTN